MDLGASEKITRSVLKRLSTEMNLRWKIVKISKSDNIRDELIQRLQEKQEYTMVDKIWPIRLVWTCNKNGKGKATSRNNALSQSQEDKDLVDDFKECLIIIYILNIRTSEAVNLASPGTDQVWCNLFPPYAVIVSFVFVHLYNGCNLCVALPAVQQMWYCWYQFQILWAGNLLLVNVSSLVRTSIEKVPVAKGYLQHTVKVRDSAIQGFILVAFPYVET